MNQSGIFKRTLKFDITDGAKTETMDRTVTFIPNAKLLYVSDIKMSAKEGQGVYRSAQVSIGNGREATLIAYGEKANMLNRLRRNQFYSFQGDRLFNTGNPMIILEEVVTTPLSISKHVDPAKQEQEEEDIPAEELVGAAF